MTESEDYKLAKQTLKKVIRKIDEGTKTAETYGTGLFAEKVIVSTFNIMTIKQLEQIRYILNQIIKKKKIFKRINLTEND